MVPVDHDPESQWSSRPLTLLLSPSGSSGRPAIIYSRDFLKDNGCDLITTIAPPKRRYRFGDPRLPLPLRLTLLVPLRTKHRSPFSRGHLLSRNSSSSKGRSLDRRKRGFILQPGSFPTFTTGNWDFSILRPRSGSDCDRDSRWRPTWTVWTVRVCVSSGTDRTGPRGSEGPWWTLYRDSSPE